MKVSTLKAIITKSANNLHDNALSLAINDDSVKESTLKHYNTIERAINEMKRLSDVEIEWMLNNVDIKWNEVKDLKEAQSREFYKRLRFYVQNACSGTRGDKTLENLKLNNQINGQKESFRITELQSIYGHEGTTQATYTGTFLMLTRSGEYQTASRGDKIAFDWNHPLYCNMK